MGELSCYTRPNLGLVQIGFEEYYPIIGFMDIDVRKKPVIIDIIGMFTRPTHCSLSNRWAPPQFNKQ